MRVSFGFSLSLAYTGGAIIMAGRADEYRRLARECLAIARTTSADEARLTLIEMARVWTRLADDQDVAFLPRAGGHQPIAQQQQQVQPKKDGSTEGL